MFSLDLFAMFFISIYIAMTYEKLAISFADKASVKI